jgi:hypothetical protein
MSASTAQIDPCPMCGRQVKRRKIAGTAVHGKWRARHKCPHGQWCAQGERNWGSHSNGNPPPRQSCCRSFYEARCRARIDARIAAESKEADDGAR